jgi:hypothetical protein
LSGPAHDPNAVAGRTALEDFVTSVLFKLGRVFHRFAPPAEL